MGAQMHCLEMRSKIQSEREHYQLETVAKKARSESQGGEFAHVLYQFWGLMV
jgi:hypothetical protein